MTAVLTRKSHHKSRNGCRGCKQRHVKCDETRPRCANCAIRRTQCVYGDRSTGDESSTNASSSSPEPCLAISKPSRKLLELELMHRWSTNTYKTFGPSAGELQLLQVDIPRDALKYDFMLGGIYAIAALDLAVATSSGATPTGTIAMYDSSTYLCAALEYYGKASIGFRSELRQLSRDNYKAVWVFSTAVSVFHLALPYRDDSSRSTEQSMLSRMVTVFEALRGSAWVTKASYDWLSEGTLLAQELQDVGEASPDILGADTEAAIGRLRYLNDTTQASRDASDSHYKPYGAAITLLERCFAEEVKDSIKGFCFVWPSEVGLNFISAMKKSEHMALFLVMHWGVLLHRLPQEAWWIESVGQNLVAELSDVLCDSEYSWMPEWTAGISWARQQVDLPTAV